MRSHSRACTFLYDPKKIWLPQLLCVTICVQHIKWSMKIWCFADSMCRCDHHTIYVQRTLGIVRSNFLTCACAWDPGLIFQWKRSSSYHYVVLFGLDSIFSEGPVNLKFENTLLSSPALFGPVHSNLIHPNILLSSYLNLINELDWWRHIKNPCPIVIACVHIAHVVYSHLLFIRA